MVFIILDTVRSRYVRGCSSVNAVSLNKKFLIGLFLSLCVCVCVCVCVRVSVCVLERERSMCVSARACVLSLMLHCKQYMPDYWCRLQWFNRFYFRFAPASPFPRPQLKGLVPVEHKRAYLCWVSSIQIHGCIRFSVYCWRIVLSKRWYTFEGSSHHAACIALRCRQNVDKTGDFVRTSGLQIQTAWPKRFERRRRRKFSFSNVDLT